MASDLDLGPVARDGARSDVRRPGVRRLQRWAGRAWSLSTPAVAAALAVGACLGAGPLPDPGASAIRLAAADRPGGADPPGAHRTPTSVTAPIAVPGAAAGGPVVAAAVLAVPVAAPAVPPPAVPPPVPPAAVPTPTPPAVSELTRSGIPQAALTAYRSAEASMAVADPTCRLAWSLLAGIGRVESNHGQFGGRRPTTDGAVLPPILGLPLDGRPGTSVVLDTDGGALDGDVAHDRAVGPMQFIPGTWARWGADGDADGVADPHDLDDAALGAGRYLCAGERDVSTPEGRAAAVHSYNHSQAYVDLVLALADAYADLDALTGPPPLAVPVPAGPVGLPDRPASVSPPTIVLPPPTVVLPPPTRPAPTGPAPTGPAPTDPAPTDPAPTDPAPTDPAPTDPAPTGPAPTDPAPTGPAPTDPAPTGPAPNPAPTDP